jgi:hypothetical protein
VLLDDLVEDDYVCRVIDAFVGGLKMAVLGPLPSPKLSFVTTSRPARVAHRYPEPLTASNHPPEFS